VPGVARLGLPAGNWTTDRPGKPGSTTGTVFLPNTDRAVPFLAGSVLAHIDIFWKTKEMPRRGKSNAVGLSFHEWIRTHRKGRGEIQRIVASATGIDMAILCHIEVGRRLPTEDQASKLARYYRVSDREMQARRFAAMFQRMTKQRPAAARRALQLLARNS
jgi:hypothetical protein